MSDVTISYNGSSIATMSAVGAKKLLTKNTICDGNIEVSFVSPSPTRSVEVVYNGNTLATLTESGAKQFNVDGKYCNDDLLVNYKTAIPSEYKEVTYLESTGTQYINSLVVPNNTTGVEIRLSLPDVTTDQFIWGCRENSGDTRFILGKQSKTAYFGFGVFINGDFPISANTPYVARMNYYNSRVANTNTTPTVTLPSIASITYTKPIYLFAAIGATGAITGRPQKIFSCKISKGQNLVRDFVPCIRVADNVAGLYDRVDGNFYTNVGTGSFTPGSPV